jgi:ATP-dependent helicase HepA
VKDLARNDIIVVDEAHRLTSPDNQKLYESVEKGVRPTTTLLLLTATPMRGNREDFLRLLHLVDPDNYSLDSLDEFELRMSLRERSARLIDAIQIKSLSSEVLLQYLGRWSEPQRAQVLPSP